MKMLYENFGLLLLKSYKITYLTLLDMKRLQKRRWWSTWTLGGLCKV